MDRDERDLTFSREGVRAVTVSLAGLGLTSLIQILVFLVTGSVALLSDSIHNVADALTGFPLLIAFVLGRRVANRAYPYGYGRCEDLAGLLIVLAIAGSGVLTGWQALHRITHPQPVHNLGLVAVAGLIGAVGNEAVAQYRIRTGRRIGSLALEAEGTHAHVDALTSLGVVLGAGATAMGFPLADPVIALLFTVAIFAMLPEVAGAVYRKLMDAVDPDLVTEVGRALAAQPGVRSIRSVRMRWVGSRLHADAAIDLEPELSLAQAHAIVQSAERRVREAEPRIAGIVISPSPDTRPVVPAPAVPTFRTPLPPGLDRHELWPHRVRLISEDLADDGSIVVR